MELGTPVLSLPQLYGCMEATQELQSAWAQIWACVGGHVSGRGYIGGEAEVDNKTLDGTTGLKGGRVQGYAIGPCYFPWPMIVLLLMMSSYWGGGSVSMCTSARLTASS